MTQTVEFDLAKVIERIEQKLDKLIEGQLRLEGEVKTLQVEVQNIKEDVRELKTTQRWVIGVVVSLIGLVGTVLLRSFNLLPQG